MTAAMPRLFFVASLLAGIVAGLLEGPAFGEEPSGLVVPPGYAIQKVAGAPEIHFPMFGAIDERGRLFVAESSGLDLYAELQKLSRTCRINVLEDRDGDGRYETSRVFADGLVFPMGLAWHEGRLYVADPPYVVALEDTDGDGRADKRTVILGEFGHQDNGSLHGLIFGPDGWLYLTMGQPDGYRLKRPDDTVVTGQSGALLRCRPDGSEAEVVSRGFENLVEIDFLPTGEIIGTDNWFYLPAEGVRDALVHLVEGGLYPRLLRDVGSPMLVSGEPLPCVAAYPAVALSGLTRYRGSAFPESLRGDLFSAQHNTRKVVRHHFTRLGATFQSADTDLVTTQDPDFHPSDVLEDADGSLLVIDTGSWYIHHCPTGRIRRVSASGDIHRVRHLESRTVADPRGLVLNWTQVGVAELVQRLSDPREAVRERAAQQLPTRGMEAVAPLRALLAPATPMQVVEKVVWTLARIPGGSVPLAALLVSDQPDRAALAARALGRMGSPEAALPLAGLLSASAAHVRLAAAEALAHCGGSFLVPAVLAALAGNEDRFVEHSLIHFLYQRAGRDDLLRALDQPSLRVQKAALVLLDQPPYNALPAEAALRRLSAADPALRQAARSALAKHGDWVEPALPLLREVAYAARPDPADLTMLGELVLAFHARPFLVEFVSAALLDRERVKTETRLILLQSLARLPAPRIPAAWAEALATLLRSPIPEVQLQAGRTARTLQLPVLDKTLLALAKEEGQPAHLRVQALAAVVRRHPLLGASESDLLLRRLDLANPANLRLEAAEILSQSQLGSTGLIRFVEAVRTDPLIAPTLVLAAAQRVSEAAQAASAVLSYVRPWIEAGGNPPPATLAWLEKISAISARPQIQKLRQQLDEREERQRGQLIELEPLLAGGDPRSPSCRTDCSRSSTGTRFAISSPICKV